MKATATLHQSLTPLREPPPDRSFPPVPYVEQQGARPSGLAPVELVKLQRAIAAQAGDGGSVTQFIAARAAGESRQISYDLSWVSAAWLGQRVLFVDASGLKLDIFDPLDDPLEMDGEGIDYEAVQRAITKVAGLDMHQISLAGLRGALRSPPSMARMAEVFNELRRAFDITVIASPPLTDGPFGIMLAQFVDSSVIVLRAGRTRAGEAAELADALRSAGGVVLGAVLAGYNGAARTWQHG